jgi:hypothetical protein
MMPKIINPPNEKRAVGLQKDVHVLAINPLRGGVVVDSFVGSLTEWSP